MGIIRNTGSKTLHESCIYFSSVGFVQLDYDAAASEIYGSSFIHLDQLSETLNIFCLTAGWHISTWVENNARMGEMNNLSVAFCRAQGWYWRLQAVNKQFSQSVNLQNVWFTSLNSLRIFISLIFFYWMYSKQPAKVKKEIANQNMIKIKKATQNHSPKLNIKTVLSSAPKHASRSSYL